MNERPRREGDETMKCEFAGCKHEAQWAALKLWGQGGTLHTCDRHKPGGRKRPESLRHLPSFYDVRPITARGEATR
jgi:hypothetical protein